MSRADCYSNSDTKIAGFSTIIVQLGLATAATGPFSPELREFSSLPTDPRLPLTPPLFDPFLFIVPMGRVPNDPAFSVVLCTNEPAVHVASALQPPCLPSLSASYSPCGYCRPTMHLSGRATPPTCPLSQGGHTLWLHVTIKYSKKLVVSMLYRVHTLSLHLVALSLTSLEPFLVPFPPMFWVFLRDLTPQPYPAQTGCLSLRQHRHSVAGVLTIQRALSNAPGNEITDGRHLTLRKAMSEERPQRDRASRSHRSADAPVTAASLDSGLSGSAFSLLEEEGETNGVDSAIFQVPRFGKIPNGTDVVKSIHGDTEGKTQVMGEIKIALKKEMKTEGEHLVLEILQCRNITYKFKTPDHLPDMYVKLYVVNVATQKRIIKKKTRVCRHDREPSFNETFRFCMNPTGHSIQLFLVSNGGKFVKKTLIGEAYVWLDKVDLRKRVVSWHKLLATTAQIQS
ncbi:hypothetical protein PHYPO_G00086720 [Pangasianodon hypophthalmus]|uniref:C2 domain-containing protein n=1 Tax=Pangasianodon hypophthalmus TaxID=310915 RepID=A0A5N5LGU8_PANHP|nr:hypothetical protein PHYPO_G00086720 [Pangasianodon hypophthalmus]